VSERQRSEHKRCDRSRAGERKADNEPRAEGYYRIERPAGPFSRSLTLPEGVDNEAVTATFSNGVLEVHIPKPAQAKPRRVQIGVNETKSAVGSLVA
jgi:HSP20 family protein